MQDGHAEPPQPCRSLDATHVSADEDEQGLLTLLGQDGEQPLEVDGEAGRGQLLPETPEEIIVAPAVGDGEPEAGGVGFVDRARVVLVASGEPKVQDDRPERPVRLEMPQYLPQVLEGLTRLLRHSETPSLFDERFIRRRTDDTRDATDACGDVCRFFFFKQKTAYEILRGKGAGYGLCR